MLISDYENDLIARFQRLSIEDESEKRIATSLWNRVFSFLDDRPLAQFSSTSRRSCALTLRARCERLFHTVATGSNQWVEQALTLHAEIRCQDPVFALQLLQRAHEAKPDNPTFAKQYARYFYKANALVLCNLHKAESILVRAANGEDYSVYIQLAKLYETKKRMRAAQRCYSKALVLLRTCSNDDSQAKETLWHCLARHVFLTLSNNLKCSLNQLHAELEECSGASVANPVTLWLAAQSYATLRQGFNTDYAHAVDLCDKIAVHPNSSQALKIEVMKLSALIYDTGGFGVTKSVSISRIYSTQIPNPAPVQSIGPQKVVQLRQQLLIFMQGSYQEKMQLREEAEVMVNLLSQHSPRDPYVPLVRGELCVLTEDIFMAEGHFEKLFKSQAKWKRFSGEPLACILSRVGLYCLSAGNDTDARKFLEQAHGINYFDPVMLCGLSRAFMRESISRSDILLDGAINNYGKDPLVLCHYAARQLDGATRLAKTFEETRGLLVAFDRENPGRVDINFMLGKMYQSSDLSRALAHYSRAISSPKVLKTPCGFMSLAARAFLHLAHSTHPTDLAQSSMDLALLTEHTKKADLLYKCADGFLKAKEGFHTDERLARAILNKIISLNPNHLTALYARAQISVEDDFSFVDQVCADVLKIVHDAPEFLPLIKSLLSDPIVHTKLSNKLTAFIHLPRPIAAIAVKQRSRVLLFAQVVRLYDPDSSLATDALKKIATT